MGGTLTPAPPAGSRVFAALVPPPEVVMAMTDRLQLLDLPGRLVPPDNWHVTLRFVGTLDEVTWDRWVTELEAGVDSRAISIRLDRLGAFPNRRRATVLWVGMEAPDIDRLAEQVEEATIAGGLGPEERPFRPHLTVARVRPPQAVGRLLEGTQGLDLKWQAQEFHLMAAVGSRYQRFATFPLG